MLTGRWKFLRFEQHFVWKYRYFTVRVRSKYSYLFSCAGETLPVTKTPPTQSHADLFSVKEQSRHMLYYGTLVLRRERSWSSLWAHSSCAHILLEKLFNTVLLIDYVINAHCVLLNPLRRLQLSKRRAVSSLSHHRCSACLRSPAGGSGCRFCVACRDASPLSEGWTEKIALLSVPDSG